MKWGITVYSFLRATVMKYHKLGGLEQQTFLLTQFWRLEVQNQVQNFRVSFW